jgi:N-acetylneuraminic acid mutarotase
MGGGYYNGKIYVVGGYPTTSVTDAQSQTWAYDIASNTWSTLLSLPNALGGPASQVIGSHLYIIGGRDSTNTTVNTAYDYSILTNIWTARSPMLSDINVP